MIVTVMHTYPTNDLKPHNVRDDYRCPCKPSLELHDRTLMVIHNAWDGREFARIEGDRIIAPDGNATIVTAPTSVGN